jgi:hypothetical protein
VNVLNELFGAGLLIAGGFGRLGSGRVDGSFVVEAVQVAAGFVEILDPFLRLLETISRVLFHPVASSRSALVVRTSAIIMWQSKVPFP